MQKYIPNHAQDARIGKLNQASGPIIWDENSQFEWKKLQAEHLKNRICFVGFKEINRIDI